VFLVRSSSWGTGSKITLREIGSKGIAVPEAVVAAQTRPKLSEPRDASDPKEFIVGGREESETALGIICHGLQ